MGATKNELQVMRKKGFPARLPNFCKNLKGCVWGEVLGNTEDMAEIRGWGGGDMKDWCT